MTTENPDARFWNNTARKYATDPIKDMAGYERTLAETLKLLKPDDHVFEIGCGTGTTALRIAPHVARLVATDISSEMIAIAREKAAKEPISNVDFAVGTPDDIAHPDATFDAVLAYNVLHLLPDRHRAFDAMRRILKPGGLFISKTTCLSEMNPLLRLAVPVARAFGKAPTVAFFDAAALEREIRNAGFDIRESARHGTTRKDARIYIVARKPWSP